MNYLCLLNGLVEYGSTSLSDFAHYQLVNGVDPEDESIDYEWCFITNDSDNNWAPESVPIV